MIEMDAKSRKGVLSSLFRRRGGESGIYTRLFDDLDLPLQKMLLSAVPLDGAELPIIGSVENSNNWFILTTKRFVWCVGGERNGFAIESIYAACQDFDAIRTFGPEIKATMQRMEIRTNKGEIYYIRTEPGKVYYAVLGVLINQARRNHHSIDESK